MSPRNRNKYLFGYRSISRSMYCRKRRSATRTGTCVRTCTHVSVPIPYNIMFYFQDGRFYFTEHVAAHDLTMTSEIHNRGRILWGALFYGCKPDRKLLRLLKESGFTKVEIDQLTADIDTRSDRYIGSLLNDVINRFFMYLIGSHVIGVAIK